MSIHYTRGEEWANTLSHALALLLGGVVCVFFLFMPRVRHEVLAVGAILLYAGGMLSSYLFSALYHGCPMQSRWREPLRKCDHAAIYAHIAGSYSPVCLIGMSQNPFWGWLLLGMVWTCAVWGIGMSFYRLKEHSNLETLCFVGMGLLVLLAFKPVLDAIGWEPMGWIMGEGAAFITGAIFYSFKDLKYMHTVFHLFVVLGSLCHMQAIYVMLQ